VFGSPVEAARLLEFDRRVEPHVDEDRRGAEHGAWRAFVRSAASVR
jgi:hypothetical protein